VVVVVKKSSMLYKKIFEKDIITEEKFDTAAQLEASLKKLLHLLDLQYGVAKCTAHTGAKFLKLQP
jgi:hypothetical protein